MSAEHLTDLERNALKWVLLCQHLGLDPLMTSAIDVARRSIDK